MREKKIWLSSPHLGDKELEFVRKAFATNWIAPLGPNVDEFERRIEQYIGEDVGAAALSSGTAAIHLALILLGVGAGDEVLCQSMTFSASANPILYQGATPVFIDSEESTWNISPKQLERAITDRIKKGKQPRAVVVVHLYGMPAQMQELQSICDRYHIPMIEDAAEALGSRYQGRPCGSFGQIAALSFNGNKIITTSGGGALLSVNQYYVEKARFLATQARDPAPHYEHSQIGYNYRMSNVSAGIGCGQMEVLEERVNQRRKNFHFYKNAFEHFDEITFQHEPSNSFFSNRWLTTILFKNYLTREKVRLRLQELNIESRPLWKPMHLQPLFSQYPYYGEGVSQSLFERGLCLPSGSNLSNEDLQSIAENVADVLINCSKPETVSKHCYEKVDQPYEESTQVLRAPN
jgi:dTDP-4-amino-4,6-dideoxygalactose transaminase